MEGQLKKKLIKYLLEDKVCNLVTEIFSTEGSSVPAPNTEVFLRRSIISPQRTWIFLSAASFKRGEYTEIF